jgi:anti-sigma factor RsiW
MTDSHVQDRLSAWLDGALPLDVANRVEQHLKSCPECAAARDALAEQDRALKAALTHEPGDEYL